MPRYPSSGWITVLKGLPQRIRAPSLSGAWEALTKLLRGSFARGVAVLASASLLQVVITMGSAPILARLFSPEQFGIAGLLQALIGLIIPFATCQYFLALGLAKSRPALVNVAALTFSITLLSLLPVTALVLVLMAYPQFLPEFLHPVQEYLWFVPLFMLVQGLLYLTRHWEIRHGRYRSMVTNRLLESGTLATAQILFGLLNLGAFGLILGRLMSVAAAASHGVRLLLSQIRHSGLKVISFRRLSAAARRHWRFPVYQMPADLLKNWAERLAPLLLGALFGPISVGFYWFANRLLSRPAEVWGNNIGRVFHQHAAAQTRAGKPIARLFWRSTGLLVLTSAPLFGLVIAFGPPLFLLVFGAEWEMAGHYARWLAVMSFFLLIAAPARAATVYIDLQGTHAAVQGVCALASAGALLAAAALGAGELVAIAAFAFAHGGIMMLFIIFMGLRVSRSAVRPSEVTVPLPQAEV